MIITLVRIYKFYFAYVTLILFSTHYKKMKHVLYCKYLHLSLHFSKTVGTIGTSPKLYKEITCVYFKLSQYL